ncbi:nitroimidazol reductase NimA-like FMN-containing flavoprotein (pyridoxamine 5'-phosphate oxidase superfamily) [Streptacidiphilus sp. MAP12-20]|uniref:pyridoxamine 5'-phosphate oxidase family protein n=1 Tax=Streptacidiphilus sp. MAP12-20 TaxID=3156299 RepID=UPI0035113F0F
MTHPAARSLEQRIADTRTRFGRDEDVWVSTGGSKGPYLVPLSFDWDGTHFVISTLLASTTARHLVENGMVRLAFGPTRDVTMVEGTAVVILDEELDAGVGESYARRNAWDPRKEPQRYQWFRITPVRIQAWREANELAGRDLMKQSQWLG